MFNGNLGKCSFMCKTCSCTQTARTRPRGPTRKVLLNITDAQFRRVMNTVSGAIGRCTDLDHKDYGGRGIKVCEAWMRDRRSFGVYLTTLPGWDDPTLLLDRIDNDGDYEPGNLRFVTSSESNHNRRKGNLGRKPYKVNKPL